ncbi:MAG: hypothetical protein KDH15_18815 [Rhodocyclaceae bacterium]|nr:hypothetical protein [Rhodocyclaceae bacterium]
MFRTAALRLIAATIAWLSWALPCTAGAPQIQLARLQALPLPSMAAQLATTARAPELTRAYAIDAVSFYFDGIRVVADELAGGAVARDDMARQRLQAALDAGEVTFDGRLDAASGALRARVWVDGRPLAELLR